MGKAESRNCASRGTTRSDKGSLVHIPPGVVHGAKGKMRVLVIGIPDIADDDLFFPDEERT